MELGTVTKRVFTKSGLAIIGSGLALPLSSVFNRAVQVARADGVTQTQKRILVVVQLAGGNDGLNTLVPYGEGKYRDARPQLALPDEKLLPVDDRTALHAALAPLKELWDAKLVAAVQGVGYPSPSLSHFTAMDIWQTADPELKQRDGWLARLMRQGVQIDAQGHPVATSPFAGFVAGPSIPRALTASGLAVPVVADPNQFKIQTDGAAVKGDAPRRESTLLKMYSAYPANAPYAMVLDNTADTTAASIKALQEVHARYQPAVQYPTTPFGNSLKLLAEGIAGNLGVRIGHVSLGGFDTHSNQLVAQERLFQALAEGLRAFYQDLEAQGRAEDVLIMTWTEFGRRVQQNASAGTDHGTVGPMFLLGKRVNAGMHGEPPSLTTLDNGNLRFTTDFRSVYASVIEGWLGADSHAVLGARWDNLGLLA